MELPRINFLYAVTECSKRSENDCTTVLPSRGTVNQALPKSMIKEGLGPSTTKQ